jgi:hypothetical protein
MTSYLLLRRVQRAHARKAKVFILAHHGVFR